MSKFNAEDIIAIILASSLGISLILMVIALVYFS